MYPYYNFSYRDFLPMPPSMKEVGALFLSHKMVVRRNKLRRKRGK